MDYTQKTELLKHEVKIFYTVTTQEGKLFVSSARSNNPQNTITSVNCSMDKVNSHTFDTEERARMAAALVDGTVHKHVITMTKTAIEEIL